MSGKYNGHAGGTSATETPMTEQELPCRVRLNDGGLWNNRRAAIPMAPTGTATDYSERHGTYRVEFDNGYVSWRLSRDIEVCDDDG